MVSITYWNIKMKSFDFTKYKRVFAFGCSFTAYTYPTWADLIFNETTAECYNFGIAGLGNLGIASRIAEANTRFQFNEEDLVIVMYTTFFREDRWIEHKWQALGNVYNQPYYNDNFVKNYVDPVGCMIRDMAQIELSTKYIESLPCDNLLLKAATLTEEYSMLKEEYPSMVDSIMAVYGDLWSSFPSSLYETMFPNGWQARSSRYSSPDGSLQHDSHPITIDYYNYLVNIGVNLSEKTYQYAQEADIRLKNNQYISEWFEYFPEVEAKQSNKLF